MSEAVITTKVAIIGGGIAGIAAYRHLTAYPSIRATIFESSTSLGSLWSGDHRFHRPDLSTNVSRHTVAFSDMPWSPQQVKVHGKSLFPYSADVGDYLHRYAHQYVRNEDVKLGAIVENIRFDDEKWIVQIRSAAGDSQEAYFDFVILASGTFTTPYIPHVPGAAESRIPIIHSANFPAPETFQGKTALVIGGSLSGVEISGMLAPYAKEVHHVHKHPFYPLARNVSNGDTAGKGRPTFLPTDIVFNRRSVRETMEERTRPTREANKMFHSFLSSVCPSHPFPADSDEPSRVGISDMYLPGVRSGVIHSHLAKLESVDPETGTAYLSSGEEISSVDVIIFGTGYTTSLPYLPSSEKAALEYESDNRSVPFLSHHLVLHPDLPRAGFVGLYRGPYFAISEMQAQYLAALIAGEKEWPSEKEMRGGVERERQIREYARDGRCQYPHDDYGGLVETYARLLDRPSPTLQASEVEPAVADQILPVNYPRQRTADVRAAEADMLETLRLSRSGVWVLRAVFWSWGGRWRVKRVIRHSTPAAGNETFDGWATFHVRPPSAISVAHAKPGAVEPERGVLEYLYEETGTSTTATSISSPARKKYIYRYNPVTDAISVWFVKEGASGKEEIESWFHDIVLSDTENDAEQYFKDHEEFGGWLARGDERFCAPDVYKPFYRFCFKRGEVQQFGIGYDVRGPEKNHVSETWYERAE
ncbi:FAD/NAD(P)-binding domain-containing protein [Neolentinus lepideus HHB14362 ss-1]|uniref:FAD/NAD(P)-binding domain-containing protein n=1 Tax=Neolentinus lepideus HHB14362 ss-1 TaxID=1314782 RepID=A0A165QCF8_9AGAM|nr:FAD/NAD(P)-binding domain-containing protein [Neolentinus lepideus HHB14362 ss-1]